MKGEFEPKKTPYIRSFYGEMDEQSQRTEYFRQREAVQAAKGRLKDYQDRGVQSDLDDFMERYAVEIRSVSAYEAAEKQRRKLNKDRRRIEGSDMPTSEKEAQLKRLDELELEIMRQARAMFAKSRRAE